MNFLTPSLGLLLWTSFCLVSLLIGLFIVLRIWKRSNIDSTKKLLWTAAIIIAPILGIILYLIIEKETQTVSS